MAPAPDPAGPAAVPFSALGGRRAPGSGNARLPFCKGGACLLSPFEIRSGEDGEGVDDDVDDAAASKDDGALPTRHRKEIKPSDTTNTTDPDWPRWNRICPYEPASSSCPIILPPWNLNLGKDASKAHHPTRWVSLSSRQRTILCGFPPRLAETSTSAAGKCPFEGRPWPGVWWQGFCWRELSSRSRYVPTPSPRSAPCLESVPRTWMNSPPPPPSSSLLQWCGG